jgi:N-acetylglucosamine malate deacetylase 1
MKLHLLAIAAHPDDAELTCGGTLIKMAARGYRVGILDLTRGEMGTRGTPEIRLREAAAAMRIMGVAHRENLGLPDAHLKLCDEYKFALAEKIRELQPATVILPYWSGRHPDHVNASLLGYEACFAAGLKRLPIRGEAFRPHKILYATAFDRVPPTFAVDITGEYKRRRRAILAYRSQFLPPKGAPKSKVHIPLDALEEEMSLSARYYGRLIGVQYAEAFAQKDLMRVEDVVELPVRSI